MHVLEVLCKCKTSVRDFRHISLGAGHRVPWHQEWSSRTRCTSRPDWWRPPMCRRCHGSEWCDCNSLGGRSPWPRSRPRPHHRIPKRTGSSDPSASYDPTSCRLKKKNKAGHYPRAMGFFGETTTKSPVDCCKNIVVDCLVAKDTRLFYRKRRWKRLRLRRTLRGNIPWRPRSSLRRGCRGQASCVGTPSNPSSDCVRRQKRACSDVFQPNRFHRKIF